MLRKLEITRDLDGEWPRIDVPDGVEGFLARHGGRVTVTQDSELLAALMRREKIQADFLEIFRTEYRRRNIEPPFDAGPKPTEFRAEKQNVAQENLGLVEITPILPAPGSEKYWPRWRGPFGQGNSPETDLPVEWLDVSDGASSEGERSRGIVWKTPIPGRGHSSPTVHGSRIFLTTANPSAQTQSVLAFDRSTGKPLWTTVVHKAVKVTVLLEGEEESGSPSLDPFLETHANELAADVCLISDTGMWDIDTPAITYTLRGLVYAEVTLAGPSHDLHSGMYGGAVVNPANELLRILSALKDDRGIVQIPGFYDDVRELAEAEASQWAALGFDEAAFLAGAGLKTPTGEAGRSTLARIWSRPTCDINGIWAGYTGDGAKTVIPAQASAKLSFRLVSDQDPSKVFEGLESFLTERTPPDCRWQITSHGASPAVRVPTDSAYLAAACRGLESVFDRTPVLMGCGGSIPVVGSIQRILGFDSLLVGFGLDDDRVHSPNEKFELKCFRMGMKSHAAILSELAHLQTTVRPSGDAGRAVRGARAQSAGVGRTHHTFRHSQQGGFGAGADGLFGHNLAGVPRPPPGVAACRIAVDRGG